jgi:hypothetical protein
LIVAIELGAGCFGAFAEVDAGNAFGIATVEIA